MGALRSLRRCGAAVLGALALAAVLPGCERAVPPAGDTALVLSQGELAVSVDPNFGGRITGLSLGGHQFLTGPEVDANNFGSTFWLSPQALWEWPPVVAHDSAPYRVLEQAQQSVRLASDPGAGATVEKSVLIVGERLLRLDYRVTAKQPFVELAAWQISRVAKRGLAFAPVTAGSVRSVRGEMDVMVDRSGVLWLPLDPSAPLKEGKVIANGSEGWLAFVDNGFLYLKLYPPVALAQMASGEGDIELYLSDRRPYLELEVQSAAQPLAAGETLAWHTYWLVERVPVGVVVGVESASLLAFVRERAQLALAQVDGLSANH